MFYAQEAARYIPVLESRLSAHPRSPVFARLASFYLTEGKVDRAVELCLEGLKHHPAYPAAHLVLGRAYEAQGRPVEAMLEYRKVRRAVPDNPTVAELLRRVEQKEQEEFRAFAEQRTRALADRRNTIPFERYTTDEAAPDAGAAEFLLERLRAAEGEPGESAPAPVRTPPAAGIDPSTGPKIVTATLAEIYASQGEYRAALAAYRRLRDQHPVDADRYERRIAQLEELEKAQHAEQKS